MTTMSIDDAAAIVAAMDTPAPETAAKEPEKPAEAVEPDIEQDAPVEGAEAAADAPEAVEEGEQEAEAPPVVDAPKWWDAEDKAAFADLTPEQQAIVAKNEAKREAVIQKEKTAAVDARKTALAAAEQAKAASEKLEGVIPDRIAEFQAKYKDIDNIDWDTWNAQDPVSAARYLSQYQSDRLTLERTLAAKAEADRVAQETFANEQAAVLREKFPEIAKPETLKALADYLPKTGIPAEAIKNASAEELVILNKARLYDEMMAKAAAKPASPPMQQKPASPAKVPPQGQARPVSTSKQREVTEARNRFAQTRSIDDAAAILIKSGLV